MMQVRSLGVSDRSLYEIWILDDIDTDFYTVRAEETGAAMIQLMFDPEPDSHGITSHAALLSGRKYVRSIKRPFRRAHRKYQIESLVPTLKLSA